MPALEHNACSGRLFSRTEQCREVGGFVGSCGFVRWNEWNNCVSHISCVWLFVTLWTVAHQPLCLWASPSKNTAMGCHALLQGIVQTQGLNPRLPRLLHCRFFTAEPPGKPQNNCTQGKRNPETCPEKWKLRCYKLESSSSWVQRGWQLLSELLFFTRSTLSSFKFLSVCSFWTSCKHFQSPRETWVPWYSPAGPGAHDHSKWTDAFSLFSTFLGLNFFCPFQVKTGWGRGS